MSDRVFGFMWGLLGVLVLIIFYMLAFVYPQQIINQERFAQSCYAKDGIVLKTTTGTSKHKHYEFVCVKKEMILE